MLMVGLTGGIGSGKSAVSARLATLGATILDADRIARDVVAPGTEGLAGIVDTFGERVLAPDGSLDRAALAAVIFDDAAARRRLEEITHPMVRTRTAQLVAAAAPEAVVVNDVPLLVEVGLAATYHLVVVVETAMPIRLQRLSRDRGMDAVEAGRRIAAQADDAQRRAVADVVLNNDAGIGELHASVDALWRQRLLPYEHNVRTGTVARHKPELLVTPDSWAARFARVAARLRYVLGDSTLRIDHIGPSAVPGLPGSYLLDIQLTVPSLAAADGPLADRLAQAGFPRCPGQWWDVLPPTAGGQRWEKRLHGCADPGQPVELHLRVAGSPGWRRALLLRDYLLAAADRGDVYRNAQQAAGQTEAEQAEAMEAEYARAEQWAARTGWRP